MSGLPCFPIGTNYDDTWVSLGHATFGPTLSRQAGRWPSPHNIAQTGNGGSDDGGDDGAGGSDDDDGGIGGIGGGVIINKQ